MKKAVTKRQPFFISNKCFISYRYFFTIRNYIKTQFAIIYLFTIHGLI
jgi:gamma-glutamylcysteine synthetase